MTITVALPRIPQLECSPDGKISQKDLDAYFKNIGRTMSRLDLSVTGLNLDDKCSLAIIAAIIAIEQTMKPLESITTDPFQALKSKELEYRYRARELGKDIEEFFKKKIVDILLDLIDLIGIPNPFKVPIPFIGTATLIDNNGIPYVYDPVIADLFTKEGQRKVKLAIKEDIEAVSYFKFNDYLNNILIVEWSENKWQIYQNGKKVESVTYEDEDEDGEHESDNESRVEEIENEIEVIDEEIQDIKDDPDGDLNESEIEEAVEDRLGQIKDDPMGWLDEMGDDYNNFIDRQSLLNDLIDENDYGVISSYNNEYDTVSVNDSTFVVMRID